jgi:hypothetical protein
MAIARQARSITFTAVNEGYAFGALVKVVGMTFRATGATAGQLRQVRDSATPGAGSILADYVVEAATDNADLWVGRQPQIVDALSISNNTVGGTWVVTVFYEE